MKNPFRFSPEGTFQLLKLNEKLMLVISQSFNIEYRTPNIERRISNLELMVAFHPNPCVDKRLHPRSKFVISVTWVMCPVPRLKASLDVRHNSQVTSVFGCDTCCRKVRTVWIARISGLAVLHCIIVGILTFWKGEFTLTVGYPHSQSLSAKAT